MSGDVQNSDLLKEPANKAKAEITKLLATNYQTVTFPKCLLSSADWNWVRSHGRWALWLPASSSGHPTREQPVLIRLFILSKSYYPAALR
ncbi:Hypothetical predicted protein [Podarcis lilfordi]|uniref:Uncharacterized protein n=1 Tax=Podarcis lilfordi TaxID=74358 RepID=A0AA35KG99_9SAUR|nr:Hypothetical predicted protein [Podarcis lilfordi]